MKKLVLLLLPLIWTSVQSQTFNVVATKQLNLNGAYVGLNFDNSGEHLLLSAGDEGLQLYDLNLGVITSVCKDRADVKSAVFSEDNTKVYFTKAKRIDNLLHKDLYAFDLVQKEAKIIEQNARSLTRPMLSGDKLIYTKDSRLKRVATPSLKRSTSKKTSEDVYVCIENQHLMLYRNGVSQIIDPCGEGSYIWPSISPDGTQLLFMEARKGAFVYDLSTRRLTSIGHVHAPKWVDDKWVVGMETKDDGNQITYAAVFVVNIDTNKKMYLSPKDEICMYPSVARIGKKIAYTTDLGKVYVVNYKINQ